jgi:hypothetical protein
MLAEGTESGIGRIKIVGRSTKVVEHDGLTVLETIGNVAMGNDNVSQWGGGTMLICFYSKNGGFP